MHARTSWPHTATAVGGFQPSGLPGSDGQLPRSPSLCPPGHTYSAQGRPVPSPTVPFPFQNGSLLKGRWTASPKGRSSNDGQGARRRVTVNPNTPGERALSPLFSVGLEILRELGVAEEKNVGLFGETEGNGDTAQLTGPRNSETQKSGYPQSREYILVFFQLNDSTVLRPILSRWPVFSTFYFLVSK